MNRQHHTCLHRDKPPALTPVALFPVALTGHTGRGVGGGDMMEVVEEAFEGSQEEAEEKLQEEAVEDVW